LIPKTIMPQNRHAILFMNSVCIMIIIALMGLINLVVGYSRHLEGQGSKNKCWIKQCQSMVTGIHIETFSKSIHKEQLAIVKCSCHKWQILPKVYNLNNWSSLHITPKYSRIASGTDPSSHPYVVILFNCFANTKVIH